MFKHLLYYISFLLCFLFSKDIVFSFEENTVYLHDFFQQIAFSEWESLDSLKKKNFTDSFLSKELSYIEALSVGLDVVPQNFIKLQQRHDQLLINNTYEELVAYPLIKQDSFDLAKQNIKHQVLVYHLLVGYKGCSLSGSFEKNKQQALDYIKQIKTDLSLSVQNSPKDSLFSVFSSFSKKYSDDPSVSNNGGFIGWVSWGRVMPSFQKAAFSLNPKTVSDPVLTPYGYHLILIEKKKPSDYAYYNPLLLDGFSKKMCLQSLSFDSLRIKSQEFDSLLLQKGGFSVSHKTINKLFSVIQKKEGEGLRGNKSSYLSWFKEEGLKDVLFVFNNKGFGVGWFLNSLKKAPPTRVPSIKKEKDLISLLESFVVQKEALALGKEKGVAVSSFFLEEFSKHKKNILYNEYVSFLINSLSEIDSSLVEKKYSKGLYRGDFIKPKSVVYSEIRKNSRKEIDDIYSQFLSSGDFDLILKTFSGGIKPAVTLGRGGPLATAAFSLKKGEVSSVVENPNKTFSIVRVEEFIEPEPFTLQKVYSQIERQLKKTQQDSIKNNLAFNLKNKYGVGEFSVK